MRKNLLTGLAIALVATTVFSIGFGSAVVASIVWIAPAPIEFSRFGAVEADAWQTVDRRHKGDRLPANRPAKFYYNGPRCGVGSHCPATRII
jgi:hypothetical protein